MTTCKQHYQDFRKLGLKAPLEAEFFAYGLLVIDNWMPEYYEIPLDLTSSPEIELALAARRALDDSNFARFFKLFDSADPLLACAMHRWFPRIRGSALKLFTRTMFDSLPLAEAAEMLRFETIEDARTFCEAFKMVVDVDAAGVEVIDLRKTKQTKQLPDESSLRPKVVSYKMKFKSSMLEDKLTAVPAAALLTADSPEQWGT